jgi:hypothetical protein
MDAGARAQEGFAAEPLRKGANGNKRLKKKANRLEN